MTITITSANSPVTFAGSTSSSGIVVTNTYAAGFDPVFINSGTIRETGVTQTQENDIAVKIFAGDTTGKTAITNSATGVITAAGYGIEITGGSAGHYNRATITNFGTIIQNGDRSASSSGIVFTTDTGGAVINSGFISGAYGGVYFKTGDSGSKTVINNAGGTITNSSGGARAVTFNDLGNLPGSSATFVNAGLVSGLVEFDVANGGANATNAGTIVGALVSSQGGGTLTLDAGQTITGGVNFKSGATLNFGAGTVAVGNINPAGTYVGFNAATILSGANFNIGSVGSSFSLSSVSSIGVFGTLNVAGSLTGTSINLEGTVAGSAGVVDFTGTNTSTPIYNYANNDEVIFGTLALPAPAAGSSFQDSYNTATGVLTTTEINAAGASIASASVTLSGVPGVTYNSTSFDVITGPGGETIALATSQIATSGSIYLDYGEHATLANSSLDNVNVTFGTHGSLTGPNVLQLNGSNTQQQDENNNAYFADNIGTISGFGLNDVITLGTANIGALPTDVITQIYDPVTGKYQIFDQTEYQRTGNINLSTDSVFFSPAGNYSVSSFVETYGTNGMNIETQATDAEQGYTFNATGTADINTIRDYSSLVAPGASIVTGEVVTIASGTATFASANTVPQAGSTYASYLQNSGTILVSGPNATFTDSATLTGGGTIAAQNGGHINILDNSGGTDAAQTLLFGTGGTSLALNTIDLNATSGSFAGTIAGFGLNDDIIIGPSLLAGDNSFGSSINNYVTLAYAGSLLTVGEVQYGAGGTGTPTTLYTTLNVGTGYSVGSFVALYGTNGINIESAATVLEQPFTLVPTAGTQFVEFTDPKQFVGGLAPGDSIISGESIIINAGTTTVEIQNPVANSGNILINSGTLLNNAGPTGLSDLSGTGTITIQNGGKFAQSVTGGTNTIAFGGDTTSNYNVLAVGLSATSFTSPITGFGNNDEITLLSPMLPSPGTASSFTDSYNSATGALTINEFSGTGSLVGTTTLTVANTGSLNATSFVEVNGFSSVVGSPAVNIFLGSTQLLSTVGSIVIDYGHAVTLSNTSGVDTIPVTFGTHGSLGGLNVLDLNGAGTLLPGNYYGSDTGTISGFGANDVITIGTNAIGSQPNDVLTTSYDTTTGAYQIFDQTAYARNPNLATSTDVVYFSPAGSYSASSFVETYGTNGLNIETPATDAAQGYTFNAAGTADINTVLDYSGLVAPGSSIVSGEVVTIASGTATFAAATIVPIAGSTFVSTFQNSGTILVSGSASTFSDYATLTGGGTVVAANGGTVNILSSSGTDAGQTLQFGTGGTSIALNTIDLNPTSGTFAGTIAGFGANDDIVLGGSVLPPATPGSSVKESFNPATGVLTVTELNAGGSVVGVTSVTLAGAGSLTSASFVATQNSNGVNIELASTPLTSAAGSIYIDYSESVTLTDTAAIDTIPVTFGTHGSIGGFNTLDINGTVAGTNSPYQGSISGFGLNDDIIIGPSTLPSLATGSAVTLSYAGSLLTVGEVNSGGTVTAATTINVGTGYSTSSFVALIGTNGINIETPATVVEQGFTFQATTVTGNFEDPTLYSGKLAPGSSIVSGETVTIVPTSLANLTTPVNNSGVIILADTGGGSNANLSIGAPLTGTGTIIANNGGIVQIAPGGSTTNTISFGPSVSGATDIAYLDGTGTASFGGVIANVGPGDNIDLGSSFLPTPTSASNISLSFNGGVLSIFDTVNGTVYTDMLTISGTVPGTFSAALGTMPDGSTGIVISDVPCFAAGTRILTSDGQVAVESIKVGDKVLTVRNGEDAEVVWVGQRTVDLARHAMPEKVRPVRILAGAFGEGLPERDLRLSPDHALYIDGHLIEAKTLVNGVTVIEEMATRFVTYHHVELATHDIMLAEGLAAESYLDSGNRIMFESDAAPMMLHPDFAAASRAKACAPLALDGDVVVAARARLLERAVALGFAVTGAVDLTARVAGSVITPEMAGDEMLFVLPRGATSVELVSSVGVPAETSALPGDRRALGVAVTGLALIANGKRMVISLKDPAHAGFHGMEDGHRWTNGAATVALPAYTGKAVLEVTINGQAMRWVSAA